MATAQFQVTETPTAVSGWVADTTYDVENLGPNIVYVTAIASSDPAPAATAARRTIRVGRDRIIEPSTDETVYVWTVAGQTSQISYDARD